MNSTACRSLTRNAGAAQLLTGDTGRRPQPPDRRLELGEVTLISLIRGFLTSRSGSARIAGELIQIIEVSAATAFLLNEYKSIVVTCVLELTG